MAVAFATIGTKVIFSGSPITVTRPTLSAIPYAICIAVVSFYDSTSIASCPGFGVAGNVAEPTGTQEGVTFLYKMVSDGSAEASTYTVTPTVGGDSCAVCFALTGVDDTTPIGASGVTTGHAISSANLSISGGSVVRDGSLSVVICGTPTTSNFYNSEPITNYTPANPATDSEAIEVYYSSANLNVGTAPTAFFGATAAWGAITAGVMVVFEPPSAAVPSEAVVSSGRIQLRRNPNYRS